MARKTNLEGRYARLLELGTRHLPQGLAVFRFGETWEVTPDRQFCRYCRACCEGVGLAGYCRQTVHSAAYQATLTGEPYFFRCWAGLNSFVLPLLQRTELVGAVSFGGFVFQEDAEDERRFVRHAIAALPNAERLSAHVENVRAYAAAELRGFAEFVQESLFVLGINNADEFRRRNERYRQQQRIADLMQAGAAGHGPAGSGLFDCLAAVATAASGGNREQVFLQLDRYLCKVMLQHPVELDRAKAEILLLLALITRESLLAGSASGLAAAGTRQQLQIREMEGITDIADLCHWASKQVETLLRERARPSGVVSNQRLSQRVDAWLREHYREKATLARAAEDVGASIPAIVKALRRDTGRTFHRQLTELRLAEAKNLLATSDLPIDAIARECGFADQSHLTRLCTRELNLSPGKFRRLLSWVSDNLAAGHD